MEERRAGSERRSGGRAAADRRGWTPPPIHEVVPWQALLPIAALGVIAWVAWGYSQNAAIDQEEVAAIDYPAALETPLLSARRIPETLQQPIADRNLTPELLTVTDRSGAEACLVVMEDDRVLSATNATSALVPASLQKVVTTNAALGLFGPDRTFETLVLADVAPVEGRIDGNLYLVGGGDPFLSTDAWRAQYGDEQDGRAFTRLEDLADAVASAGITEITGQVRGDESLFDTVRYGPWAERLILSNQSGPLSALSVNEGFTEWPSEFTGSFRPRVPATDPALNAATVFAGLLTDRGVLTAGGAATGAAPVEAVSVTSVQSPPLADLVVHINSYSNNYGAEILTKHIGLSERGIGSTEAGAAATRAILELQRLPVTGVRVVDGSGLAETDLVTCDLMADILERAAPDSPLVESLSIGGERGSLALRHEGTPADGRVFAKTGTLNGVTALTGVTVSASRPDVELVFAYIVNGQSVGLDEELKALQIPLVEALVAYPNAPDIGLLGPRPARVG